MRLTLSAWPDACGFISTTGVAGLTLGGGIGYLSRRYGLTIDNLLSVDMVLADGSFVTANSKENSDLFWAVRGGGGNFGVVTSFEFRLHPVNFVQFGPTFWPLEDAASVLKAYRDFIKKAPEYMGGFFAFLTVPPSAHVPGASPPQESCARLFGAPRAPPKKPRRPGSRCGRSGNPFSTMSGPLPFRSVQSIFDGLFVTGLQWYWRADNFTDLSDEAIARHVEHGSKLPTMLSTMHLYPVNGAPQRVGKNETAYSFREALFAEVIVGVDPDPANARNTYQMVQGLLGSPASVLGRRRVRKLHDGRGPRPRSSHISRQLSASAGNQEEIRSRKTSSA